MSADITEENWEFCESLLLRAALSEPTMLSVLADIYDKVIHFYHDDKALTNAIESICWYHAPLQHGNEVSWALWLAKKMNVNLSVQLGDLVASIDDDLVALVALDLIEDGKLQAKKLGLWRGHANADSLYDDHWLLAYEAHEHSWLSTAKKSDYVATDPFFSLLQKHDVRFYGTQLTDTESYYAYSEDSDESDKGVGIDLSGIAFPSEP